MPNFCALSAAFKNFFPFFKFFPLFKWFPKGIAVIIDNILSEDVKFFPVTVSIPVIASFNPFKLPTIGIKSKATEIAVFPIFY